MDDCHLWSTGGARVPSDYANDILSVYLHSALQLKIAKINKTTYFGSSGSFKVIDLDRTKKLVTIVLVVTLEVACLW